jgi:hypothetical protein
MNFFVCVTTIKKYEVALEMLITSLPNEWKHQYILVYQNENENSFKIFEDGHIEVYITNNLSDYGNYVGINMLLENKIVPDNSWFLFIHDTCKFNVNSAELTYKIIEEHNNSDIDILWLCDNGQCNICLIRKNAIIYGNKIYKDINYMSKMDTVACEWRHDNKYSPKSFCVVQKFLNVHTTYFGKRYVYNNNIKRDVLLYETINMEKYFYHIDSELEHPLSP